VRAAAYSVPRMLARRFMVLLGMGLLGAGACGGVIDEGALLEDPALDTESGGAIVSLRAAAFIQCPVVGAPPLPYAFYAGDGRGFSYAAARGQSRMWVDLQVDPSAPGLLRAQSTGVGETRAYGASRIAQGVNDDPCPDLVRSGASPSARKTATPQRLGATARWLTVRGASGQETGTLEVTVGAAASNPIAWLSPNACMDYKVRVEYANGVATGYSVSGTHDGFPAYELYLNRQPVYTFDSNEEGGGPLDLFPPAEVRVNVPLTSL
jgi:hypothetical protein